MSTWHASQAPRWPIKPVVAPMTMMTADSFAFVLYRWSKGAGTGTEGTRTVCRKLCEVTTINFHTTGPTRGGTISARGHPPCAVSSEAKPCCHAPTIASLPIGAIPSVALPKKELKKHSSQQSEGLGLGSELRPSGHRAKQPGACAMTAAATLDCRHE